MIEGPDLLLLLAGFALLVGGAELLVRGASRLATAVGVSPLVIGLTVVAYGTSAPELAVSLQSTVAGKSDIALGNVVGSSIFNILFVLGISALVVPLLVARRLIRLEVPLLIGVCILLMVLALDGRVGRLDGAALFGGAVAYTVFAIRRSRRESLERAPEQTVEQARRPRPRHRVVAHLALIVAGFGLLALGSRWLVDGAVEVARALGLSELIIGLTIVAVGTSLPEVATSVLAALRGERDMAVGNVVGSNLFNILVVLGLAGLLVPGGVEVSAAALRFDIPVMLAVTVACLPIFFIGNRIARWEGALFLAYYAAYTLYLIMEATGHDALPAFSRVMMVFVVPITVVTLAVLAARSARAQRRATHRQA